MSETDIVAQVNYKSTAWCKDLVVKTWTAFFLLIEVHEHGKLMHIYLTFGI